MSQPLIMEEGEILKVQAADANELHVIASILEIQPRDGNNIMIELQPDKIIEKIVNKKTGERYKNDKEWKDKGISPDDIQKRCNCYYAQS